MLCPPLARLGGAGRNRRPKHLGLEEGSFPELEESGDWGQWLWHPREPWSAANLEPRVAKELRGL